MRPNFRRLLICVVPALIPVALFAFSAGPPVKHTGARVDGLGPDGMGLSCTQCHADRGPANSDTTGSLKIETGDYAPGVTQTIRITLMHPTAQRWGFQLTARSVSDETKEAGTLSTSDVNRVRCGSTNTDAPCNGDLEFAEHVRAGTFPGQTGGNTWEIQWTPPSSEIGDIVFYAAGNAANNDGNLTGDHIYTTSLRIHVQDLCNLTKKPTLRTLVNGASFDNRLSPNAIFSVLGTDFQGQGLKRQAGLGDFVNGQFPAALGCVAVEIGGKRAPISYVQGDQINAQVPTGVAAGGPVSAVVILNPGRPTEVRSDIGTVTIQNTAPAFFTFLPSKSIAAVNADGSYLADPSNVPGGKPAKPGDIVSLFGTGFGFTDPIFQAGEITAGQAKLPSGYTIAIGGITLSPSDILYAGLAPQQISGLYQFNVKIPAAVTPGAVPVSISAGGQSTQTGATIPVAAP